VQRSSVMLACRVVEVLDVVETPRIMAYQMIDLDPDLLRSTDWPAT
jgi:hypothetical protein